MKYSIIIPYYKKAGYINNTLLSYKHWYSNRNDYEVIIIEDIKNHGDFKDHSDLLSAVAEYKKDINIKLIRHNVLSWNPSTHFNHGVRVSSGSHIVLTNPECLHTTDVLDVFDKEFTKRNDIYVICGCKDIKTKIVNNFSELLPIINHKSTQDAEFCDPDIHWCSVIGKQNYLDLGGFDEIYSDGYYGEDNDWQYTVQHSKIKMIHRMDVLVIHQTHPKLRPPQPQHDIMAERNRRIMRVRWKTWPW